MRTAIRDNLIKSKENNVRRHNEKKNTVHLELKPGDTVLVRLGQNKRPETDHFLVTKVNGKEITPLFLLVKKLNLNELNQTLQGAIGHI